LGAISLQGLFHEVDIGEYYRKYLNEVTEEAYKEITGSAEGLRDLTYYMLYRGKNIIDGAGEEEKVVVEIMGIERLKSYMEGERDGKTAAGVVATIAAVAATAGAIAAAIALNPGLAAVLGAAAVASGITAGTFYFQANALDEVITDLNDKLNGRRDIDTKTNEGFDVAYKEWKEKKGSMEEEWRKLNLMYYGQETKPEMISGPDGEERLPEVTYKAFIKGN
jgi:hypothetical protein